jgi:hypothetical protein
VCIPAISDYEAKERHDLEATMTKVARFNGVMGVARDELKLLKACRPRPDFELVAPSALPPDNQAGVRPVTPLLARAAFCS